MIEQISVKNFKCHRDTTITLDRVTALIGPNSGGKTALLQAAYGLCGLVNKEVGKVFSGEMALDSLVRNWGHEFSIGAKGSLELEQPWEVTVTFATSAFDPSQQRNWRASIYWKWQDQSGSQEFQGYLSGLLPNALTRELGQAAILRASPKMLSQPSAPDEIPPKLSPDGGRLAAVVASLILSEPERHRAIEEALRTVVPVIKRVRARQTYLFIDKCQPKLFYELVFDTVSADSVPAHAMSGGTLLLLGLLTLLGESSSPQLVLLDDVEQGIHPSAQRGLMRLLKEFAEKYKRQILLTSHSPYIVDELDAKDVWVVATDKEGVSHAKRLSEHPDAERALSVLTTGELWDAEGEAWVIKDHVPVEEVNA